MERPALNRRATAIIAAGLLVGGGWILWQQSVRGDGPDAPTRVLVPEDIRVKVEVLNATRTRGLARRATFALRAAGFDVVRFTSDTSQRDTTLILDRSGHERWARLVQRALGTGRVESRPDTSRYLDVTVLLGSDWRPPAKPFYP